MKKYILVFFIVFGGLIGTAQAAVETIKVGGYYFPPFVDKNDKEQYFGIAIDLIKEMNYFQDKFYFQFVPTSPKRRYSAFEQKEFDLIMFEDLAWGWKNKDLAASKVILQGGEVYITKAEPFKNQSYFDSLKDKSFAVILGYHYGFAGFNADEKFLKKNFKIKLNTAHSINIKMILSGRTDISVVSLSNLNRYLKKNPGKREMLLVSEKFDQQYNHRILLRKDAQIDVLEMNTLLTQMDKAGILLRIWEKYGILSPANRP
ncbi:substrate-binding periplasmic protein [Psychromonas ossibalaenae]|uniref:substrate-binding periplasmic protein n=1 Tax=Psychromonas ossibalaenae TaxID=444922 RepID=UPI00037EF8E6|nr:transporter substrate-binding domain-containing protein [Psychromonas ossibalaenae]